MNSGALRPVQNSDFEGRIYKRDDSSESERLIDFRKVFLDRYNESSDNAALVSGSAEDIFDDTDFGSVFENSVSQSLGTASRVSLDAQDEMSIFAETDDLDAVLDSGEIDELDEIFDEDTAESAARDTVKPDLTAPIKTDPSAFSENDVFDIDDDTSSDDDMAEFSDDMDDLADIV